ncbi:MAG TPA: serine hydrolase domain-containing protein [Acidimicrobiales bacterium]|nr:serine hydrolase domain-containing protein [Acidimicrobiales bacterium]
MGTERPGLDASTAPAGPLVLMESWEVAHAAGAVVSRAGLAALFGDPSVAFAWASVTKLCTALAVLVACEETVTGLDSPAGPPGSTVRHLLAHASGLGPDDSGVAFARPGARRIYSNAGYEVLAGHLAGASGIDFPTYVVESVLEPAGMGGAELAGSPAAGMRGTIGDLAALAFQLLDPVVVDPETLRLASSTAFPELDGVLPGFGRQRPCPWGLGPEVRGGKSPHWTGSRNSPATFGHFGQTGTFLWVDPEAGVACAVLTDRAFGPWAATAWPALADEVLGWWATNVSAR